MRKDCIVLTGQDWVISPSLGFAVWVISASRATVIFLSKQATAGLGKCVLRSTSSFKTSLFVCVYVLNLLLTIKCTGMCLLVIVNIIC